MSTLTNDTIKDLWQNAIYSETCIKMVELGISIYALYYISYVHFLKTMKKT